MEDPVEIVKTYRCASIDIGVINLAFCIIEFYEMSDETFEFDLIHVERATIGSMKESIHRLGTKLIEFYANNEKINENVLDYVFIEQQLARAIKNCLLSYVTMTYFETMALRDDTCTNVQFVPPKAKFQAVKDAFGPDSLSTINFDRKGRELKKLSVEIARVLFDEFSVTVGLQAMKDYRSKLDDVSDVFLQSFALFLKTNIPRKSGNPIRSRGRR